MLTISDENTESMCPYGGYGKRREGGGREGVVETSHNPTERELTYGLNPLLHGERRQTTS
jgi:hypothetical protein